MIMAKWVRLPDNAQVTMSRGEFESTQGISLRDKVIIAAVIIFVLWLMGQGHDDNKGDHNRPQQTTTSTPRSVDHG